ncbi:MAG: hypothetical protein PHR92_02755 [Lachnospiraceae bacterium]|nr:hypothetical protein [Lachnospiraceae bacterium]
MNGAFAIESNENGELNILFKVTDKCDVDMLTLEMMSHCDDVLYEPGDRNGSYESCLLCNEKISIKIRTMTSLVEVHFNGDSKMDVGDRPKNY